MRVFFLLFLFCFCFQNSVIAFDRHHNIGAKAVGLGQISSSLVDLWAVANNQAAMAFLESPEVGVAYEERLQLKELRIKSLAGVYPLKNRGIVGAYFMHIGDEAYSEVRATLSYAMLLGKYIAVGVGFDYCGISVIGEDEGVSGGTVTGELGILVRLFKDLWISSHLYNPFAMKITQHDLDEYIPVLFRVGTRYHFSKTTLLVTEIEKDIAYKTRIKLGVEYTPIKNLELRTGIATQPLEFSLGIGYRFRQLFLNMAFYKHRYLGYTPSIALSYQFQ